MDTVLESALRKFVSKKHIRNVLSGEWVDLFDNHGNKLLGIRGRIGVSAPGLSGHEIGLDLMEMQPGSSFPLHSHAGDHVMYIVSGRAICHVDQKANELKQGDSIVVPAELPHGFACPADATEPVVFVAVGHPHRHLSSRHRMSLVEKNHKKSHDDSHHSHD